MKKLGKYEILDELGRGGFAIVYKARDTTLDRIVALKILHPQPASDRAFVQRFYHEARTAANLRHHHIVTIYELGEKDGQHYLAMEFLPGPTLSRFLESARGPLPLEQTTSIIEQVAGALDYIHNQGLVHRDVKPSNIIVDDAGQATLLDFGLVRAADGTELTTTGTVMGTPQYMSPEQAEGEAVDRRSDIYSLGVVAYHMCTGKAPFDADSPIVVLRMHADKPPITPRRLNPRLSVEIERVLLKALAKKRDERHQEAGQLALDLRRTMEAIADAQPRKPAPYKVLDPDRIIWEKDGKEMVRVPAGKFLYGDAKKERELSEFWIDKTPVTNAEYARFVADTDHSPPQHWGGKTPLDETADHPVTYVSWHDAVAYAEWAGKRLPSEEEWEKAARGTDGWEYPWGPWEEGPCNTKKIGVSGVTSVSMYSPRGDSPYGCVDMAGNVWEWTGYRERHERMLRGGSWYNTRWYARCAFRFGAPPGLFNDYIGFRTVFPDSLPVAF